VLSPFDITRRTRLGDRLTQFGLFIVINNSAQASGAVSGAVSGADIDRTAAGTSGQSLEGTQSWPTRCCPASWSPAIHSLYMPDHESVDVF
jgi:hypothetical protein